MPGFTTHYIIGMKAYNDLKNNQLKHIIAKYRWLYQLGVQGPDIFFYNIPILRHRDYRNVGSYMHEAHVGDFFRCCLAHISQIRSRDVYKRHESGSRPGAPPAESPSAALRGPTRPLKSPASAC